MWTLLEQGKASPKAAAGCTAVAIGTPWIGPPPSAGVNRVRFEGYVSIPLPLWNGMPLATPEDSPSQGIQDPNHIPSPTNGLANVQLSRINAIFAAITLGAAPLGAQYALGVGATIPTGDFGDAARPGWMLAAGWSPWATVQPPLRLWLQGYYGRNPAKDMHTSSSSIAMAGLGLSLKPLPRLRSPSPYLIGAVGVQRLGNANGSSTAAYVGGGAGFSIGRNWLQARYQAAIPATDGVSFLLIAAGTSF